MGEANPNPTDDLAFPARISSGPFMVLANLIPLSGAILLIVFGEKEMTLGFRLLVSGLIGVGMAGVIGLVRVIDHLNHLTNAWTETRDATS